MPASYDENGAYIGPAGFDPVKAGNGRKASRDQRTGGSSSTRGPPAVAAAQGRSPRPEGRRGRGAPATTYGRSRSEPSGSLDEDANGPCRSAGEVAGEPTPRVILIQGAAGTMVLRA